MTHEEFVLNWLSEKRLSADRNTPLRFTQRDVRDACTAANIEATESPTRDLLKSLERDGLIRSLPSRGFEVVSLTRAEVQALFQIREAIEPLVAETLAGFPTESALHHDCIASLEKHVRTMIEAKQSGDVSRFVRADIDFHLCMATSTASPIMSRTMELLGAKSRLLGFMRSQSTERLGTIIDEHNSIIASIDDGDASAARGAATTHLRSTQDRLDTFFAAVE